MAQFDYKYKRKYRTRAGKNTKYISKRKGASAQQNQLMSLQKQVTSLAKRAKLRKQFAQFKHPHRGVIIGNDYYTRNLLNPPDWAAVFQATTESQTSNKAMWISCRISTLVNIEQTGTLVYNPFPCTYFIVSLRKDTAQQTIVESNDLQALIDNVHYNKVTTGTTTGEALVMLNPALFKIHHMRRFMIGQAAFYHTPNADHPGFGMTTNVKDSNVRINTTLRFKRKLKTGVGAGSQLANWKLMAANQQEATDRLYCLIFSGAEGATQSINVAQNVINNIEVTN